MLKYGHEKALAVQMDYCNVACGSDVVDGGVNVVKLDFMKKLNELGKFWGWLKDYLHIELKIIFQVIGFMGLCMLFTILFQLFNK